MKKHVTFERWLYRPALAPANVAVPPPRPVDVDAVAMVKG